ncbi:MULTISPECIES: hypothetical protein [Microbacterium]|uniref:Secreted protein n=1 Tax=Microbacterium wangchenii TaxID=2541726 RepID=A0ABX5SMX6_9MICO|nr:MULTISPECIES: hypothetical protein [Microbacterium]MCK6066525.1 hypothetical protein [Microbacterium sp. EYE_512]QBR87479.1 hypothetical protein E4K62_01455 [Microbacterium wangchenii]
MRTPKVAVAAGILTSALALSACVPPGVACPAIGFVLSDPVVIEIDPDLVGGGSVAACLGDDCEPALVASVDPGKWEVPQEPPYAPQDTIGLDLGAGIRVAIVDAAGATIRDEWFEIPFTSSSDGVCPGPVEVQPVVVT